MTRATALVCTKDRPGLIGPCLESLLTALGVDDELIVVESGERTTEAVLDSIGGRVPNVRVIHSDVANKSHQLNVGIETARGEILLLTDDDARVEPSWPEEMIAPFQEPAVGLVCGRVTGLTMAPGGRDRPDPVPGSEGPHTVPNTDGPHAVPAGEAPFETWTFAHGVAMAVRRTVALQVGFDERLGPGASAVGEDHDFLLRIRERGWKVVVSSAPPVLHVGWRSPEADRANALAYERGSGAVLGAAIRRRAPGRWRLLRSRLGYQRRLLRSDRRFGIRGLSAFFGGLGYGLTRPPRMWLK